MDGLFDVIASGSLLGIRFRGAWNKVKPRRKGVRPVRVFRYLKHSKAAVALILALLIVQAFAELSLPRFTSDLVDVGIQQSGVEHASPEQMRSSTFALLCMLADASDEELITSSYNQNNEGTYILTETGSQAREELDAALEGPMAIIYLSSQEATEDAEGEDAALLSLNLEELLVSYQAGALSKDEVAALVEQAQSEAETSDDLTDQQAIQGVIAEYEALGLDTGSIQMTYLLRVGAQMLGVTALMAAAAATVGFIASRTAAKISRSLREQLFAKVLSFSDAEVQHFSAASLITRGTNDIQQIQMVTVMVLRMVVYSPILAVGGIIMVSATNLSMGWVIVLAIAVMFLIIGVLMSLAMPKFKIMQKRIDRVNLVAREILTGLPVIRAFGRQSFEGERFDAASSELYRTQLFTSRTMSIMMPSMTLVMNGVSVLIVWLGSSYINQGVIQTGDMIAFITYSMVVIMSFLMIGMMAIMLPRADVAAERVNEVLAATNSIADPAAPAPLPAASAAAVSAASTGARIELRDVTFAYDKESAPALRSISFTAQPGSTLAIIGPTGSGKTTILKLIERFYDVDEGCVLVDGIDVRALSQHDLRSQIGYVPQKAFLFSGTVADTVRYGVLDATDEEVERAATIAQARDFILDKEEGFASPIAEGGTNVSGGQRQRLSIARAVATHARAYLFDDSFSALDYATDARLRAALADELGSATKIIVAQRISTVIDADWIVVLDQGCVRGQGTHAELLTTCSTYREIAESQLSAEEIARTLAQAGCGASAGEGAPPTSSSPQDTSPDRLSFGEGGPIR